MLGARTVASWSSVWSSVVRLWMVTLARLLFLGLRERLGLRVIVEHGSEAVQGGSLCSHASRSGSPLH